MIILLFFGGATAEILGPFIACDAAPPKNKKRD
jgi:hypothetical protein